jgi:hypothetical protein
MDWIYSAESKIVEESNAINAHPATIQMDGNTPTSVIIVIGKNFTGLKRVACKCKDPKAFEN